MRLVGRRRVAYPAVRTCVSEAPRSLTYPRRPPSSVVIVQAGAARLEIIVTTTMELLSAPTTIEWIGCGERHGRLMVLAAATFGSCMTVFFIISPIMEGLCGGWATLQAAMSACGSGCTSGVFYFDFAMASAVGALLIRCPFIPIFSPAVGVRNGAATVTPVFYVAALAWFTNLMLALFLFLESLGKKKAKGAVSPLPAPTVPVAEEWLGDIERLFKHITLFLPKTLYADHIDDWVAERLTYYVSIGSARTLHLLLVLRCCTQARLRGSYDFEPLSASLDPRAAIGPPGLALHVIDNHVVGPKSRMDDGVS
ncbi:hypothetical protein DICSQDRAFT_163966 [Dichomitus squalens LYAD-421 SS1]|uniref:Uncharacterized protein n=1 Tax=Dichomitus squalens (strain LYAD-421) TaxID=732165 RepID=R7SK60_DICSQ|nr:uncharacterized protein DICSQDRAFT_163966 [Dichomitus squalens LYAD-421 SS1]EJF56218.1 hypothetical protein DICSQDRAFT_163966 [Dichomitus squalens LYAD-421 SS1]